MSTHKHEGPRLGESDPPSLEEVVQRLISTNSALHSRIVHIVEIAMGGLQDGEALNLPNTFGELLRILTKHAGERHESEGAVECLERIILERDFLIRHMPPTHCGQCSPGCARKACEDSCPTCFGFPWNRPTFTQSHDGGEHPRR